MNNPITIQIAKEYGCQEGDVVFKRQMHDIIFFQIRSQEFWAKLTETGKLKKNSMRIHDIWA